VPIPVRKGLRLDGFFDFLDQVDRVDFEALEFGALANRFDFLVKQQVVPD